VTFHSPEYLLALLLVPLAAVAYVLHERRARAGTEAFALPAMMASVAPRRPGWRRHVPMAVIVVALAAIGMALARPQVTVAVPIERASVILVFDRSGSMQANDVQPSRLAAARRAAQAFLTKVPSGVRVGAIAFNQTPQALQSPTTDRDAVRIALDQVKAGGTTATGDALRLGLKMTRSGTRPGAKTPPAAIVLLSDGKSVRGVDPMAAAREAAQAKVPVYTVALGTPQGTIQTHGPNGTMRTEQVPPDPQTMQRIAQVTNAQSYRAEDLTKLEDVYKRLGSQVATERRPREITSAFAGGALLLLAGAAAASLRWFGRVI
jgi:Ca-activated chloride channel family protein